MKITEVTGSESSISRLAALAQFVSERSKQVNAEIGIRIDSFIELAHGMGVSISKNEVYDLVERPPLNNLIKEISDGKIIFHGQPSGDVEKMPVDQAEEIVGKMAKRASGL